MAIQKNPFLKYLIKDDKQDVFHSSEYARAQSGDTMGASSTESFQVRVNINQNRTRIRGYNDSRIVTGAKMNAPKAKTYAPPNNETGASTRAQIATKRAGVSIKKVV